MALTPKQQRFRDEYLIDLNATKAAIRAGYSERTAEKIGSENLYKPELKEAIDRALAERSEKTKIDAQWVLDRLANEASADIADLYSKDDGSLLPVHEWPLIFRQGLIQGIDVEEIREDGIVIGRVRKVKLDNRVKRLELIGKHIGVNAFQDVVKHTGLDALADRMERAMKRDA
ncbi:MAG: terminase small subunit [Allorhizobium sp.]